MADPNVSITFSGNGEGAIRAANSVGEALVGLAVRSAAARSSLVAVGAVMDSVSAKSAKVTQLGAAYQSASVGIHNAMVQSQQATASYTRMAEAAAKAAAQATVLNQTTQQTPPPRTPNNGRPSTGGSSAGTLNVGGPTLSSIGSQAAQMAGLAIGTAAVGNELRKLITSNMDLDSAMSSVAAVGGLDKQGDTYKELTALVVDYGQKTQYTAVEAAQGLKELVAAGYEAATAGKLLGDTLDLAATENMDMGRASEILVASLQSFGLAASDSTRVVDVMARAANASTASVDDMGEAMKFVAPVARALGISLEETSAAIAIMSNNGIKSGMAGRGLSSLMARMVAPSKDAKEALEAFGLSAAEINPQLVGMQNAFSALNKLDNGALVKLFGAENLDVSNVMRANAESLTDMNSKMSDVSVTAKEMGQIKNDNLAGDWKKAMAALETLRRDLGKPLYAAIRGDVQKFTTYLRENKTELIQKALAIGRLAVKIGEAVLAFAAIKTAMYAVKQVSLVAQFAKQAAAWILDTQLAIANTKAWQANAKAKSVTGTGKKGLGMIGGAAIGATIGAAMVDDNDSKAMMAAKVGGGAVAGAATSAVVSAVAAKIGPALAPIGAMVATKVGAIAAAAGTASAGIFVAALAAGILAGAAIGVAVHQFIMKPAYDAADNLKDVEAQHAQLYLKMTENAFNNADTEEKLAAAKAATQNNIASAEKDLAAAKKAKGENDPYTQSLQLAVNLMKGQLATADEQYAIRQKAAALAAREAAQAKVDAAVREAALEKDRQRAVVVGEMLERSEKLKETLDDTNKAMIEAQSNKDQVRIYGNVESGAVSSAKQTVEAIRQSLASEGLNLSEGLINKGKEMKTAKDVSEFYAGVLTAIQQKGDKKLLGAEGVEALAAAWKTAQAAATQLKTAKTAVKKDDEDQLTKANELNKLKADIRINEAKASGDTKRADQLKREQDILEEQLRIIKLRGTAADDVGGIKYAKELATRAVDANLAANGKDKGGIGIPPMLSRGAQGVNLLFGRNMNAGLYEEAKQQTSYLKTIATAFEMGRKIPIELIPVFGS